MKGSQLGRGGGAEGLAIFLEGEIAAIAPSPIPQLPLTTRSKALANPQTQQTTWLQNSHLQRTMSVCLSVCVTNTNLRAQENPIATKFLS
jgi:hypothetical protein